MKITIMIIVVMSIIMIVKEDIIVHQIHQLESAHYMLTIQKNYHIQTNRKKLNVINVRVNLQEKDYEYCSSGHGKVMEYS